MHYDDFKDCECERKVIEKMYDLNTNYIDLHKSYKNLKNRDIYNMEVVNRVMTEALTKFFPEDGVPEEELSQDEIS